MSFNEYENMHGTIRTVDQLLEDLQDLNKAVNDYRWANEQQGAFIRNVYERLGIFQDEEEGEGVNVDACFNKALSVLDSRLSYFEGTSQKAIARSDRYAEWLDDIEAELFGERTETFTHGDHERQSERIGDILGAVESGAARLMPKGMSWPRFEGGAPVRIGDEVMGRDRKTYEVAAIHLYKRTFELFSPYGEHPVFMAEYGERVKRPAKVLDADGAEIREGDTVWTTRDLDKFTVTNPNNGKFLSVSCKGEDGEDYCCYPTDLTHRAPVLAADGKPLHEGETVWRVDTGVEYWVKSGQTITADAVVIIRKTDCDCESEIVKASQLTHQRPVLDADGMPIKVGDTVYGMVEGGPFIVTDISDKGSVFVDAFPDTGVHGSMLTHTKPEPDTWDSVWMDVSNGCETPLGMERRCRALAEKGE